MGLSTELLVEAIDRCHGNGQSSADLIQKWELQRQAVKDRDQRIREMHKKHEEALLSLMSSVLCSHDLLKRVADPSGGSDRTYECAICGEYVSSAE